MSNHDARFHHHHEEEHSHSQTTGILSRLKGFLFHSHHHDDQVDDSMAGDSRGTWALKISLAGLSLTAFFQLIIVGLSGSVALLSDAFHNVADAATSIPLWIAFSLIRRGSNDRFTYGYGKTEDVAGIIVVLVIFSSSVIAVGDSFSRFFSPHPMTHPGWVAAASVVGFLGNEAVAYYRIRVGEEIGSTTLIADGKHSRVDGLASLLVLVGVVGQWMGYPLLDPLVGMVIAIVILSIVWTSGRLVLFRLLDAIEPVHVEKIRKCSLESEGVISVADLRARWVGHRITAQIDVEIDPALSLQGGILIGSLLEKSLHQEIPFLGDVWVRVILANHRNP